jgi:HAD superfamily hydrolase (TIGR01509 family)
MDGVLVDTEKFICEAAVRMFAERGVKVKPEDFIPFIGAGENRYIGGVAEKYGFKLDLERDKARTYELYGQIVKGRLQPLPGVLDFINKCRAKGLKLAVATSADKVKMLTNLREIGLPETTFDAVVNGLDVKKKKPDPEIFLTAARKLKLKTSDCLVVEDAVNGIAAAKAAGAKTLGITTSFTPEQLNADWSVPNLALAPTAVIEW